MVTLPMLVSMGSTGGKGVIFAHAENNAAAKPATTAKMGGVTYQLGHDWATRTHYGESTDGDIATREKSYDYIKMVPNS